MSLSTQRPRSRSSLSAISRRSWWRVATVKAAAAKLQGGAGRPEKPAVQPEPTPTGPSRRRPKPSPRTEPRQRVTRHERPRAGVAALLAALPEQHREAAKMLVKETIALLQDCRGELDDATCALAASAPGRPCTRIPKG